MVREERAQLSVHRAHLLVEEELTDAAPERMRRVRLGSHNLEDLTGDRGIEPRHIGEIILHPVWIAWSLRSINVIDETEFGQDDLKRVAPVTIVRGFKIQDDRNVVGNGDELDLRGGERVCGSLSENGIDGGVAGGGGGRVAHRCRAAEAGQNR